MEMIMRCTNRQLLAVVKLGGRHTSRFASSKSALAGSKLSVQRAYDVLGVTPHDSEETIKQSFLKLAKMHHPDSIEGNKDKFILIQDAYERILQVHSDPANLDSDALNEWMEEVNAKAEEKADKHIQYTAPQHRQYLEYEGHGSGTPFDRQRQYQSMRAVRARHQATTYQIDRLNASDLAAHGETALSVREKSRAQKFRAPNAVEQLVEDLIQESMARGEFSNLKGYGKPLKHSVEDPYVDFTTRKLNEMLIDNGFMPEWLLLRREIEQERQELRNKLKSVAATLSVKEPTEIQPWKWERACVDADVPSLLASINKKIDKHNCECQTSNGFYSGTFRIIFVHVTDVTISAEPTVLCPALNCQLVQLTVKRESEFALAEYREKPDSAFVENPVRIVRPEWGVECDPKKGVSRGDNSDKEHGSSFIKNMFRQLFFDKFLSR